MNNKNTIMSESHTIWKQQNHLPKYAQKTKMKQCLKNMQNNENQKFIKKYIQVISFFSVVSAQKKKNVYI